MRFSRVLTAPNNLDCRRRLILASISALMLYSVTDFLSTLSCQTREKMLDKSQTSGNIICLLRSKLRVVMSSRLEFGKTSLMQEITQLLTSVCKPQDSSAWTQSSWLPEGHLVHTGLSFCLRRCRREFVGRILCSILNKKLV